MFGIPFDRGYGMPFNNTYRCYSVAMLPGNERDHVNRGGKIIMPPSALDQLSRLNVQYPMLFKLTNTSTGRVTHCGVLEFVAEEGKVHMPYWMMKNLLLEEGSLVQVESVSLQVATYSKFQPLTCDFLDITDPKAVLENALRNFACLTTGDVIAIEYNGKSYELCILESKPGNAVSIIECDMNVEFAPPIGYKEPGSGGQAGSSEADAESEITDLTEENGRGDPGLLPSFVPFHCQGNRLDGKAKGTEPQFDVVKAARSQIKRGIPDYDYVVGTLKFFRNINGSAKSESEADQAGNDTTENEFKPFTGGGQQLFKKK